MDFIKLAQNTVKSVSDTVATGVSEAGKAVTQTVVQAGGKIGEATINTSQAIVGTTTGAAGAVSSTVSNAAKTVTETAVKTGEAIGGAVAHGGTVVVGTVVGVKDAVVNTASQTTNAVTGNVAKAGETVKNTLFSFIYGIAVVIIALLGVINGFVMAYIYGKQEISLISASLSTIFLFFTIVYKKQFLKWFS